MTFRKMTLGAAGVLVFATTAVLADGGTRVTPSSTFAAIELKPVQTQMVAGGLVSVDVHVNNARDLAVYQLQLTAVGGDSGTLTLESISVSKERADFVFAGAEILDAVDMAQGRVGALRFTGGTNVDKQVYLATFTFRASADARGAFRINLARGEESFLTDSMAQAIPHRAGADVAISVDGVAPTRVDAPRRK